MDGIAASPLQWPQQRPRTKKAKSANFKKTDHRGWKVGLTIADALGRLQQEIDRLGVLDYVLSTNVRVRLDGLPRSSEKEPDDPGVALYFRMDGKPHCLPCDTYDRVADNIAAIAAHIEATRAIARYGVANVAEMFTGFLALPAPTPRRPWREVLEINFGSVRQRDIEMAFRKLARKYHPDNAETGSTEKMAEINLAKADALMEIGV